MERNETQRMIDTWRERLDVMQHYADGGAVVWPNKGLIKKDEPNWKWDSCSYKKVPTQDYRQYTDDEMNGVAWCGKIIVGKDDGEMLLVCGYFPKMHRIRTAANAWDAEELFRVFTWLDGTQIGTSELRAD